MRIVGGRYRGLTLPSPPDRSIRPTSDRLRERLFNILTARRDPPLDGARVADLFAGTGALGFEALSRGAERVTFVEQAPAARRLIAQTVDRIGAGEAVTLLPGDAARLPRHEAMDLVFLDPPYGQDLVTPALAGLVHQGWLQPGSLVVAELERGAVLAVPDALVEMDRRAQKGSELVFWQFGGSSTR